MARSRKEAPTDNQKDCKKCTRPNSAEDMVGCDKCEAWYHYSCGKVNSTTIDKDPFLCKSCEERVDLTGDNTVAIPEASNNRISTTKQQVTQSSNKVTQQPNQAASQSNRTTQQRNQATGLLAQLNTPVQPNVRQQLALQRLDEEMELMKLYLDRKFKILASTDPVSFGGTLLDKFAATSGSHSTSSANITESIAHTSNTNSRSAPLSSTRISGETNQSMTVNQSLFDDSRELTQSHIGARHVMPKELPTFSGDPLEWPMFLAAFENTTRSCAFTSDENMARLQRCLKGIALETVRSLLLRAENVPEVLSLLKMRFGRPDQIIFHLIAKVKAEPSPKPDNLHQLINFAVVIRNLVATIESTGLTNHLDNPTLLYEMVEKLPASMKLDWARHKSTKDRVNLSTFGKWINEIAQAASDVVPFSPAKPTDLELRSSKSRGHINTHSDVSHSYTYKRQCCICNDENHSTVDCERLREMSRADRWSLVVKRRLCSICFGFHRTSRCRVSKSCGIQGCLKLHHELLHRYDAPSQPKAEANMVVLKSPESSNDINIHRSPENPVLFRILPVTVYGKRVKINTYAFLDDGSSLSLIESALAKELGLSGPKAKLCMKWTGGIIRSDDESQRLTVEVSQRNNSNKFTLFGVRTISELELPIQTIRGDALKERYSHLKGISITSYEKAIPQILIGVNNFKLSIPLEVREGSHLEPYATKTRLGWAVAGSNPDSNTQSTYNFTCEECECNPYEAFGNLAKDFFAVESYGVQKNITEFMESSDDRRARQLLEFTTKKKLQNRYETGLLWKYDNVTLPNSLPMALRRLFCFEKKLAREPNIRRIVQELIREYEQLGYIRKLRPEEIHQGDRIWYLPLFTVRNPNKPSKVRLVWDAAATVDGISLNTTLLKGPDLLPYLTDVLWRFRERRIAISGDIRQMFHQVQIREEDRNSQRFLYRENIDQPPSHYVMNVMTFGAACSPCSAQFIKNLNAAEHKAQYPQAADAIVRNHYVDDFLGCADTEAEASQLAFDVQHVHSKAGFELRNWLSNSKTVLNSLDTSKCDAINNKDFLYPMDPERILGLWWETSSDTFCFFVNRDRLGRDIIENQRRPSKREVLRILMMIFDPIGLIAHFLAPVKMLLQDIWRSGVKNWDQLIMDDEYQKFQDWVELLPLIEDIRIERCYLGDCVTSDVLSIELHVFVDASEQGCAAVCYYRISTSTGIRCTIAGGKTKVAPLQYQSIPRLELQAAVLGVRLKNAILNANSYKTDRVVLWSDSQTVLHWIKSDHRKFKQYVAARIGEILESTNTDNWRWVPTKDNAADDGTKWKGPNALQNSARWFTGPDFLQHAEVDWPKDPTDFDEHIDVEFLGAHNLIFPRENISPDFENCSEWRRILRAQVYVLRFIHLIKTKSLKTNRRKKKDDRYPDPITKTELNLAENVLFRRMQTDAFEDEIAILESTGQLESTKYLHQFVPYIDEEKIIRGKGRIDEAADILFETKRPIILPKSHRGTKLLIADFHRRLHHQFDETVVNEVRQRFIIPHLRSVVRRTKRECMKCKIQRARPTPPQMAPLPIARLASFFRPFSYTGLDYFGPMEIVIGRRVEKRWCALFTCMTVRGIHLELVESLSTDSCILAIRNFMAIRGHPLELWTDNATNFHGAKNELDKERANVNDVRLQEAISEITWKFIPPGSPHMGGAWERLVRSVKNCLRYALPTRRPKEELLRSILMEVVSIINSRPLTYVGLEDTNDEALTPNHFIIGSSSGSKPVGKFADDDLVLRKSWRISQRMTELFWKRWTREYLPFITKRTKWYNTQKRVEIGDVVILWDDNVPNSWIRGIVVKVVPGKEDQIRSVWIKTSRGEYHRPVAKVAVLDVKPKLDADSTNTEVVNNNGSLTRGEDVAELHYSPTNGAREYKK